MLTQERPTLSWEETAQRRPEHEGIVGPLVNQIVIREKIQAEASFRTHLSHTRTSLAEALTHRDLPYSRVYEAVASDRGDWRSPLFSVKFVLQTAPAPVWRLPDVVVTPIPAFTGATAFDVLINLREDGDTISGTIDYARDIYDATTIEGLATDLCSVLIRAFNEPDALVLAMAERVRGDSVARRTAARRHRLESVRRALFQPRHSSDTDARA